MLIPNVSQVERSLGEFADIMEADEVLLFEKSTFLIIAHAQRTEHRDVHRFEKISNIIKQFKLSCIKLAAQFTVSIFHIQFQFRYQNYDSISVHGGAKLKVLRVFRCFHQSHLSLRCHAPIDLLHAHDAIQHQGRQEAL